MWDLEPQQRELADWATACATRELAPLVAAAAPGAVNRPLLLAMGRLGLLGRLFPGYGADRAASRSERVTREAPAFDLCLLREALARVSTEAETALALQGLGAYPILQSGSADQVHRWIPAV